MPNIKSAKKRVLVNNKKTEQNKNIRSAVKSEIKKVDLLIANSNFEEASKELNVAFKMIDSAASKNIYAKNNASNKKAKLSKKLFNAMNSAKEEVKVEEVKEEVKEEIKEEVKAEEVKEEKPVKKTTRRTTKKAE